MKQKKKVQGQDDKSENFASLDRVKITRNIGSIVSGMSSSIADGARIDCSHDAATCAYSVADESTE